MLDEGPSKLYDALSLVLGLEDLVNAQTALAEARLARQKSFDIADRAREELVEQLKTLIADAPTIARQRASMRSRRRPGVWTRWNRSSAMWPCRSPHRTSPS